MSNTLRKTILFLLICYSVVLNAQDTLNKVEAHPQKKAVRQIDVVDVGRLILKKDIEGERRLDSSKHIPGKPNISVVPALGYTLQTGFAGVLSGNIAFYASHSESQKLSSILTGITYSQYKQYILPLQASLWSKGNKYNVVVDWRYMKYPSTVYGLHGNTSLKSGYRVDYSYLKIHQSVFRSITKNFYAGLGYYLDYLWNIKELDLPAGTTTVFQNYGFTTSAMASGLAIRLLYDSRLNQINPVNGFYSNIVYRPNFTFMGSDKNWHSMLFEFRKFLKLPFKSNNVLALWSYNWFTLSKGTPYLLLPSTGWDDAFNTGRGYIQGRFRDRNMIYLEAEYRYGITRNGLLGGVVFANAQSFSNENFKGLGNIAPGWGAGLRIKINKISGSNLCIDYGFGLNGSRGFFVNLNEVF